MPVTTYKLELPGPKPRAVHVISATGPKTTVTSSALGGDDWAGVNLAGMRDATIIWRTKGAGALTYTAPKGLQVVLDAPDKSTVTATADGASCKVTIAPGGTIVAPAIFSLDAACKVIPDPESVGGPAPNTLTKPAQPHARQPHAGCCGAQNGPASPVATGALVLGLLKRPRRRKP
jgi:hypothetical protein